MIHYVICCLIFITRRIKGICGLTQEIVIGLVANLKSREQRRVEYEDRGLSPEHPWASGQLMLKELLVSCTRCLVTYST
jgi:hypothetical protein